MRVTGPTGGEASVSPRAWLGHMLAHHDACGLEDTPWTHRLPRFQRDAAVRLIDLLDRMGGALLADDVGLGKTHVAGAVIRSQRGWRPLMVVAPAAVLPAWQRHLEDVPAVTFCSFARLSRGRQPAGGPFGLVVVDEAHGFRHTATRRYAELSRAVIGSRLLLITATPIHNSERDCGSLMALLSPRRWETTGHPGSAHSDLAGRMVRRSRWTVRTLYGQEHARVGSPELRIPVRRRRVITYDLDAGLADLVARAAELVVLAMPEQDESGSARLLESLLLRRLESSPAALLGTLRRCRNYLLRGREAARLGRHLSRSEFRRCFGHDPLGQIVQCVLPFFYDGPEGPAQVDWDRSLARLNDAISRLEQRSTTTDAKLSSVLAILTESAVRTLVMTAYEETARYLAHCLARSLPGRALLVTGTEARHPRLGRVPRSLALAAFSPRSQGRRLPAEQSCDLLIATDVLGEGVNLQDAQRLIHYDRPWNPMAVEQRIGRIDRLGSAHATVEEVVVRVARQVERRLGLEQRLRVKRSLSSRLLATGGTEEPVRLTAPDRVGIDLDGFIMACASRVGLRSTRRHSVGTLPWRERGWLIALKMGRRLVFEVISDGGSTPLELLVHLIESPRADLASCDDVPPPPPDALDRIVTRELGNCGDLRLWRLEPRPARASALRQVATRLAHDAELDYRLGDRESLLQRAAAIDGMRRLPAAAAGHVDEQALRRLAECPTSSSWLEDEDWSEVEVLGWLYLDPVDSG